MNIGTFKRVLEYYRTYTFDIATKNVIYQWNARKRHKSYGVKNPDKYFYVIRSIDDTSKFYTGPRHNLMANYFYVLSHMMYAENNGLSPVVDQLNYPVYISQEKMVHGSYNPWEYFWEQPYGNKLDDVYESKNVILSKREWFGEWDMGYDVENYTNKKLVAQYHALAEKVPLNTVMQQYCEEKKREMFTGKERILGVSVRIGGHSDTAYSQGAGHPKQPSAEEMVQLVETRMTAWNMDKVFLATDSDYAVDTFRQAFSQQLIVMSRMRSPIGYDKQRDIFKPMYTTNNIIQTSKDYIVEMQLLANCDGLLGSVSSGLRYAVVQNNAAYEHIEIVDYGRFADNRAKR